MIHSYKDAVTENDTKYIKGRTLLLLWAQSQKIRASTLNTLNFLLVADYGSIKYKPT